jgi:hypothetical protein
LQFHIVLTRHRDDDHEKDGFLAKELGRTHVRRNNNEGKERHHVITIQVEHLRRTAFWVGEYG